MIGSLTDKKKVHMYLDTFQEGRGESKEKTATVSISWVKYVKNFYHGEVVTKQE